MRYQSDLTDFQWELIKDHFSVCHYYNHRKHPIREMVNAILNTHIYEAEFREILRLFVADLTTTQISELTKLERNTTNRIL